MENPMRPFWIVVLLFVFLYLLISYGGGLQDALFNPAF